MAAPTSPGYRPLLSSTTILILSGFLIGIAVGNQVDKELAPYLFRSGLVGMLTFIVLEQISRRRTEAGQREVEKRLQKHILTGNDAASPSPGPDTQIQGGDSVSSAAQDPDMATLTLS